jgi:phage tail sheath gpL-like
MKEFEYKITTLTLQNDTELVSQLNNMGDKGWEVAAMLYKDDVNLFIRFLFKRELVYQRNPMECGPL